ncbi:hypothetical protein U6B65_13310 [Oscillospiraceae bacterium MB08-C2-2]|nr:hypothetical protein U6B65_13310 [Oscillospiraceae bacterium MB08-C2-2]
MKKLQMKSFLYKYRTVLFILVGLFILCIGGVKIYNIKQQEVLLADGTFEYNEVSISYISTVYKVNPEACLPFLYYVPEEEVATPTFWCFRDIVTDQHYPNGLGIEYPKIQENQELIFSYGRAIEKLRYIKASMYPPYKEKYYSLLDKGYSNQPYCPYGVPLMSKVYEPNTVYFYAVDKGELKDFPDQAIQPSRVYSESFEIAK